MHSIATCPQCAAQLALPAAATATDHVVCPECNAEFCLADGDQRWLATAELIPPPEASEPEPAEPTAEASVELHEPRELSTQQTISFDELPVPPQDNAEELSAEEPQEEPQEQPQLEPPAKVSLDDLATNERNAETLVSTSALSAWEDRLRTAIDAPAEQEDESQAEHPSAAAEKTPLEDAPEFDFHMDPPAEKPVEHQEVPADELTKTAEWFQSTSVENLDQTESMASEPQVDLPPQEPVVTEKAETKGTPLRKRRRKNSLLRLATVFTLFGVAGMLLGQYALLWLYGPSADYVGLSAIVPRSMMPSATSQLLAPQITPVQSLAAQDMQPDGDSSQPSSDAQLADQLASSSPAADEIIRDEAVVAATAELLADPAEDPTKDPVADLAEDIKSPLALLPPTGTTSAEFAEFVETARAALPRLIEGDISSKQARAAKGQAYMTLCRLAEQMGFANSSGLTMADANTAETARSIFRSIAAEQSAQQQLAYITRNWWGYDQRPTSGVILMGRIESADQQQGHTLYQLRLETGDSDLTIPVAIVGTDYNLGDTVGVAGTIVADPGRSIPGFNSDLPQIVVSHFTF